MKKKWMNFIFASVLMLTGASSLMLANDGKKEDYLKDSQSIVSTYEEPNSIPTQNPIDTIDPVDPVDPQEPSEDPVEPEEEPFDDSVYETVNWNDKASESYAGGSGTKADPYQISTAEELAYLSKINNEVANYSKNKYFILTKDIVLNDGYFEDDGTYHDGGDGLLNIWTCIGYWNAGFHANFDGQGYSVSGAYINTENSYASAFFGLASDPAEIKNLCLKNCAYINCVNNAGGFVSLASSKIEIDNCSFDGVIIGNETATCIGGMIGQTQNSDIEISKCTNYGKIVGQKNYVGGMVGYTSKHLLVTDCKNYGEIKGGSYVGGIGGCGVSARDCVNYGKVIGKTQIIGGIAGTGARSYINCTNYGMVVGVAQVGGIAGSGTRSIINCKNYGYIEAIDGNCNFVGGILGYKSGSSYVTIISKCYNYGNIKTDNYAGGILGVGQGKMQISNCNNYGDVHAWQSAGIASKVSVESLIKNCDNRGNLIGGPVANTIASIDETSIIYDSISVCKAKDKSSKIIFANNMSSFYKNDRTGYVGLSSRGATTVWMTSVDEQTLINNGFTVYR